MFFELKCMNTFSDSENTVINQTAKKCIHLAFICSAKNE